jgi:hypothetical protein
VMASRRIRSEIDDLYWLRPQGVAILYRYLSVREGSRTPQIQFSEDGVRIHAITESTLIWMHDVGSALSAMSERHRRIVELTAEGYAQHEIATALGICRKTVQRQLPDAMDELALEMAARGLMTLGVTDGIAS